MGPPFGGRCPRAGPHWVRQWERTLLDLSTGRLVPQPVAESRSRVYPWHENPSRPPWMRARRCSDPLGAGCRAPAWRSCAVCERPACRDCRAGHCWTWTCLRNTCRPQLGAVLLEARRAEREARMLVCPACGTWFAVSAVRWLEPEGPEEVLVTSYVRVHRRRCSCPDPSPGRAPPSGRRPSPASRRPSPSGCEGASPSDGGGGR